MFHDLVFVPPTCVARTLNHHPGALRTREGNHPIQQGALGDVGRNVLHEEEKGKGKGVGLGLGLGLELELELGLRLGSGLGSGLRVRIEVRVRVRVRVRASIT